MNDDNEATDLTVLPDDDKWSAIINDDGDIRPLNRSERRRLTKILGPPTKATPAVEAE